MGLEFLARVRRTSVIFGLVAGLMVTTYSSPSLGLALVAGCVWGVINLFLIEVLVVALTGAQRGTSPALVRSAATIGGMMALFGAGAFLLTRLSPAWLMAGFGIPFAVIVAKAGTLLLLSSSLWKRVVASPWRAVAFVALLGVAAWAVTGTLTRPTPADAKSPPASHTPAEHPEGDTAAVHGQAGHDDHAGHDHDAHAEDPHAAGGHAEGGHGEGGHGASSGPQKFANVITILSRAYPDAAWAHFLHDFEAVLFALLVAGILTILAFVATRNPKLVPGPAQNVAEAIVEGLNDFVTGILGPKHAPRYVPFLGSLFIYIMCMNLFGIIPFMDSPTSSLNVTFALAIVVFLYAQYIGFKELGVVGYFDHMLGNPRSAISWGIAPILFPIHLMGELAKPISLSCRLFGNIFGEDMLLVAFATLGVTILAATGLPFGLPLHLPFLFLALLTSVLQALVFTVLTTIYFLLMLPHDDHAHEHEGEAAHAH